MFTSYEYVIVHKIAVSQFNRFGNKWISQILFFKLPKKTQVFSLSVPSRIDISQLEKGDKIKLNLAFFVCGRGKNPRPRYRIDGLLLLD